MEIKKFFEQYDLMVKHYAPLIIKSVLIFALGLFFIKTLGRGIEHLFAHYYSVYVGILAAEVIHYLGLFFIAISILDIWGVKTTQFLGAAGVLGVAIGFASQTSLSNIISGIFLIGEHPFVIGDTLKIGDVEGRVDSIDLLSVKLITRDNDFIRIPNTTLLSDSFINLTRFGAKRLTIIVGVAYETDFKKAINLLKKIADENPFHVKDKLSTVLISDFGDSAVNITTHLWVSFEDLKPAKSWMLETINNEFNNAHINMPYPETVVQVKVPKPIEFTTSVEGG